MENLFPIVLTDCAAANEEINNAKLISIFLYRQIARIDSMASPAPTLSNTNFAKALLL